MSRAVEQFEHDFASWLGAAGAVATGFGRGAMWLAAEAAGVRGGDVVVPDFICEHVVQAVERAGARAVPFAVSSDLTVAPEAFRAALTEETRAAVVAHYFGRALPTIGELAAICREHGILLIEDCALALDARHEGRLCGSFGDLAVFSCTKSDWCFGGGIVATRDIALLAELRGLQREKLTPMPWLCLRYGVLKWIDFLSNRPRWSDLAARLGPFVQRLCGIREENFYDAGRPDAAFSVLGARRARRLSRTLEEVAVRRRRHANRLLTASTGKTGGMTSGNLFVGSNGSFLLLESKGGPQELLVAASERGITLRRTWTAYQRKGSPALLPSRAQAFPQMLVLEIHPSLAEDELARFVTFLEFAVGQGWVSRFGADSERPAL